MDKKGKEIKKIFVKFWCNNIKTHYKHISVGIGTLTSSIITAIISFFIARAIICGDVSLAMLAIGIFLPIQGFINALCFYIFGKTKNGNGYKVPETKMIVDIVKKDDILRNFVRKRIVEYMYNDSKLLNNLKKEEDEN